MIVWAEVMEPTGDHEDGEPTYQRSGKKIPLDASAPVYRVRETPSGSVLAVRADLCFVLHHKTCRDVGQFSKGKGR